MRDGLTKPFEKKHPSNQFWRKKNHISKRVWKQHGAWRWEVFGGPETGTVIKSWCTYTIKLSCIEITLLKIN